RLYEPVYWSHSRPSGITGPLAFRMPTFSMFDGKFSCLYNPSKVKRAQTHPGIPPLDTEYLEALALIEEIAHRSAFQVSMRFEPGDIQFLNNHVCIHGRTAFQDYPEHDRKRYLLRIWLSVPNSRPLNPNRAEYWDVRPGAVRGGIGAECGRRVYTSLD
ncbi:MAG: TauD/TfdA family dioxygenase, partial [Chloroflexi bacterium]|nr:TauD/TfdA family dioxygenase [Chloroflexota bacterium]